MSKLNICKSIVMEYYRYAQCGIFNCRNNAGDKMTTIYKDGLIQIDICYEYEYFEVFGLSNLDFAELKDFYWSLEGIQYVL